MIRVAFGSVPKDGGTFTFYRNMRPVLQSHGVDLRCVTVGADQSSLWEDAFADEGCVLLAAHSNDLQEQARIFSDWCDDQNIDIVFGVNSAAILLSIPHLSEKIRVLARCANGFDEGYRLTMMGQERLARIIALVPRLQHDLIESYGADPDRTVLIPNGTLPERFAAAAERANKNSGPIELGFLGRLEHNQKGVLHLPPVLDRLDAAGVDYRLTIAGKGKHEPELRRMLNPQLQDGRVRFVGTLNPNQIPDFLAGIDLFLFPSHFEGCPNALLEAMMSGTVPVAWQLPGITDFLLVHGQTGILVPTGDVDCFADAIIDLSRNREKLAQISCKGAANAKAKFSVDVCKTAYISLFNQVMSEPPPAWTPRPWDQFQINPMFRQTSLARLIPASQRRALRSMAERVLGTRHGPTINQPPSGNSPTRVHQIINSFSKERGGAERLARALHRDLRKRGVDARLVALEACDTAGLEAATSFGFASPYDPRALFQLSSYAKQIAPNDIVHVHLFPSIAHVAALARVGRMPGRLVFTEHNTSNRRRGHRIGGLIDEQIYRPFNRIIAISKGVEKELTRVQPSLSERTIVIENGCDLTFSEPQFRNDGPVLAIASAGRLTTQKNYFVALEAIAQLRDASFRYLIAGDGPDRTALEQHAAALGLDDRVRFMGHLEDIPSFLASSDIFLMPSKWEGFGLAAVEAMNASLPVVAANVPGLREVVGADGDAGLLVDPDDPQIIADALMRLQRDPELRRAMGARGFRRAAHYNFDRFVSDHLQLYRDLKGPPADAA